MPPLWRAPLLALGFAALLTGLAGGLARLAPAFPAPGPAIMWHGALMAGGFFGAVIGLERAVAVDRTWAYGAPLAAGLGGILILAGSGAAAWLLVAAGVLLCAAGIAVMRRQASLETAVLLAGAACWLAGNVQLARGGDAPPWWIAFFALTIGAERLELSRYLKKGPFAHRSFIVLAAAVAIAPAEPSGFALGLACIGLAAWLATFDLARFTVRQRGLPRFVAACLLAGYFWLAAGGALLALGGALLVPGAARDAALHAVFLGFAMSMVFGHAPVIAPAVLRVAVRYRSILYLPLVLLHASLAVRVIGDLAEAPPLTAAGAWGNAAAILLFLGTAVTLAAGGRR
ncbi:MAG: hypothetical protein ACM30H_08820 [Clostridia bacterium]